MTENTRSKDSAHRLLGLAATLLAITAGPACALPAKPALAESWERATAHDVGLRADLLEAFLQEVREGDYPGVTSLLVVRGGRLAVEEYFGGNDGHRLHTMQSVSKSFSSAILGIAIAEGVIGSTNDRVLGYFPDQEIRNRDAFKEALTIEDLLTMRSGTDYHERGSGSPHSQLNRLATGWSSFYLDRPMVTEPGSQFVYDSGAVILSSALIQARTGMHADKYARDRLFGQLGIESHRWHGNSEGHPHMGGGLYLRPTDMARFGQMFLDDGRWNGTQVISKQWVKASFEQHVDLAGKSHQHVIGYGYWWWIFEPATEIGATLPFYAAYGANGQFIFVVPEFDLVVVVTGKTSSYRNESAPMRFMYTHILPAVERPSG